MDRAVEEPLDIHLAFSPEGESIKSQGGTDMSKYGFCGRESFTIDETTFHGIDLPLHLLGEGLGQGWGTSLEEVDLPCFCTVRITKAFFAQGTGPAVGLVSPKLDGNSLVVDNDIGPVTVEAFAGRTNAVALILAHCKIACRIGSRRTKERGLLFSEAFHRVPPRVGSRLDLYSEVYLVEAIWKVFLQAQHRGQPGACASAPTAGWPMFYVLYVALSWAVSVATHRVIYLF